MINYSIGGSERQYRKDTDKLKLHGIEYRVVGLTSYNSKKHMIRVDAKYADQMKALGFHKTRNQWD